MRIVTATHAFNYIVLSVNPGLTSCEDLAICDDKHVTIDINTVMI